MNFSKLPQFRCRFWYRLSLLIPLYFGLISLLYAFSQPYLIQDDARLHLVWLQQWIDPDLFPGDLIAHYYQTIQSKGFQAVYRVAAALGIAPLTLAKLLPTLLALIASHYLFHLTLLILPVPACAYLTTLLLNQNIWLKDDLISATPRALIYPLFTAFLYYLAQHYRARQQGTQRQIWGSALLLLISLACMSLIYPQMALVAVGILTLGLFRYVKERQGNRTGRFKAALLLWFAAVGVVMLTVLPFQHQVTAQFGSILTAAQMQQMPEFGLKGRREYFGVDPLSFAFRGASGLRLPLFPPILWVSLALPWLLRTRLPSVRAITPTLNLLPQVMLSSVGLFLLAHLLFPKLYLPSRYTFYSFRVIMPLAAGLVLWLGLEKLAQNFLAQTFSAQSPPELVDLGGDVVDLGGERTNSLKEKIGLGLVSLFAVTVVVVPAIPPLFLSCQGWIVGTQPELYQFFAQQPKESLIASLTPETDNLPAFSQRSVLVSRELALAYHAAFYNPMQQRIVDLIKAQYSPNLADLQTVIDQYGIDFWLIDRQFATSTWLAQQDWLRYSSFAAVTEQAIQQLEQGISPALTQTISSCTVFSAANLLALEAACLRAQ